MRDVLCQAHLGEPPLTRYVRMRGFSSCMAEAARAKDWSLLSKLEAAVMSQSSALLDGTEVPANREIRAQRVALIKDILADDREARQHACVWIEKLTRFLGAPASGESYPAAPPKM